VKDEEGSYRDDVKHGIWTQWNNADHKKLEETFVNGVIDGKITIWYDNGNKDREGVIRNNEKEGIWNFFHPNGETDFIFDYGTGLDQVRIAELEERDGIFYKIGQHKSYTGMVIETGGIKDYLLLGRFSSGKRDGQWVQWYRNGQKEVEGVYYRGKKHGDWSLWYEDGTLKEQGQFDMGKVDGSYKYWYSNGHLHMEQTYHKGNSHGKWAWWFEHDHNLTFTNGTWAYNGGTYQAENEEELWNWWWYLNDNKEMEGHYIDGRKNGIWTWWYDTGVKQSEGNYLDDEQDGLWLYFATDGSVAEEVTFSGGERDGRSTVWLTPEEKQEEKFYKHGRLDGPSTYWENGYRSTMTSYKSDKPEGPWAIWYPNSDQIKEQGFHQGGIREGLTTYYYEDGVMQREGYFKNGLPDGVWTYWNTKRIKDFDFDFGSGLEQIALEDLVERESIFYKLGEDTPFTGIITQENQELDYLFLGRTQEGKKDGQWVKWFPSGKDVPEIILVDVPEPEPDLPWSGGKQEQGGYKNGKMHGQWTEWHDNEHVKSHGNYDSGIMNGHWTFFYQNGTKEKEGNLANGTADGLWLFWNENAEKVQEGTFTEGTKEGKWTAWFSDGRLTEGFYANGKKDATWASWWDHERTRKEMQGAYRNGKMVDKWFFYDKNGNLKEIRYFSPAF